LPQCVDLPPEDDPDSFARKYGADPEALKKELERRRKKAVEFVLSFFDPLFSESPLKAYREILGVFSEVKDPFLKREIVRDLSLALDLPEDEIRRGLSSAKKSYLHKADLRPLESKAKLDEDESLKIIAQFIYNHPEYLEKLEEIGLLDLLKLKESCYSNFVQVLIREVKKGRLDLQYLPDPEFQEFLSELIFSPPFEDPEEVFFHLKNYIKTTLKKAEVKKILKNLQVLEKLGKKEEIERYLLLLKNSLSF
jgi:DNA primase